MNHPKINVVILRLEIKVSINIFFVIEALLTRVEHYTYIQLRIVNNNFMKNHMNFFICHFFKFSKINFQRTRIKIEINLATCRLFYTFNYFVYIYIIFSLALAFNIEGLIILAVRNKFNFI